MWRRYADIQTGDRGDGDAKPKGEGMTEPQVSVNEPGETTDKTQPFNTGTVISIRGSVVDILFDKRLPPIRSLLRVRSRSSDQLK
ncbi:hypothetical protein P4S72_06040 [Vibrio sp. PP-XX7]